MKETKKLRYKMFKAGKQVVVAAFLSFGVVSVTAVSNNHFNDFSAAAETVDANAGDSTGKFGTTQWKWDATTKTLTFDGPGEMGKVSGTDQNSRFKIPNVTDDQIEHIQFKNNVRFAADSFSLFSGLKNLKDITGLENVDTSQVVDMSWMFALTPSLQQIDLSSFNTPQLKYMAYMFYDSNVQSVDFSSFNTTNLVDDENGKALEGYSTGLVS
ncbi:BspA family leucine-rich repeat surface protein [Fructobacillus sp. M2-14]|uniref:BspA family leucine-rich repeat surface protein n=1 Tax=Fructobacillus broussonetiae TaxID=2713173 RepID=A0ABS5R0Y3_9LACO|nr:BspA family leucine-rich repeat surface protein [Fructobacillus broussonetiae]MBS9339100.1 BspA family leucine-rich repeat surface protein [Fructobacillus broussonetiae]